MTILLSVYNPVWTQIFKQEAALIQQVLGANYIEIHHVGSTSVEGLIAKPIIDIIAVVKDATYSVNSLEAIGYNYKGEYNIPFRFYFSKNQNPRVHLHLYTQGNAEIELNILFRDYLRNHPKALMEYASLKLSLLSKKNSSTEKKSKFSNYTLGKNLFIQQILQQAKFDKFRIMHCTHHQEWENYHRIRRQQIFNPIGIIYDPCHPTISAKNHYHFVLYKGTIVVTVAHVELLNENEAALRSLATDEPYKNLGYGTHMLGLIEQWIKHKERRVIKMHARLSAEKFYRKSGYINMPFEDPCIQKEYVDLGKRL